MHPYLSDASGSARMVRAHMLMASVVTVALTLLLGASGALAQTHTPYQAHKKRLCPAGPNCRLDFPAIPAGTEVELKFVSCFSHSSGASGLNIAAYIYVYADPEAALPFFLNIGSLGGYSPDSE